MLIDSHCHLSFKNNEKNDLEGVLERAAENDVTLMINIGAGEEYEGNVKAVQLAKKYPQIFATVGIHPHDAKIVDDDLFKKVKELSKSKKVVAIGEIGLDFHYNHSPQAVQKKVFEQFIHLAKDQNKPIVIHDRDAGETTLQMLKASGANLSRVMIHCFTGTKDLAKEYLAAGCILSFTGIITFKKSTELQEVVKLVPIEKMLVETDSPFLTPEPNRSKKNEPSYVKLVAQR